jgi:hypothetical protein
MLTLFCSKFQPLILSWENGLQNQHKADPFFLLVNETLSAADDEINSTADPQRKEALINQKRTTVNACARFITLGTHLNKCYLMVTAAAFILSSMFNHHFKTDDLNDINGLFNFIQKQGKNMKENQQMQKRKHSTKQIWFFIRRINN